MTIEDARKNGLKVYVEHHRPTKRTGAVLPASRKRKGNHLKQNGGFTVVTVLDGTKVSTGVSVCSDSDCYCYKTGAEIALGRALSHLAAVKA